MDSLTQIVLGAAVGETVLGRKLGNRAMVWGAIGGTIPDMDIVANFVVSELDALAFHRGITHSIFFSVFGAFLISVLVHRLYASGVYRRKGYKTFVAVLNMLLLTLLTVGVYNLAGSWVATILVAGLSGFLGWRLVQNYVQKDLELVNVSYGQWVWLFFLAFFTHIVLDSFTAFGTQLFQPFSNYRVAFNTIAVADPGYTLPFLIMLLIALSLKRHDPGRRLVNWLGIGLSSLYLMCTVVNKQRVDRVFTQALEHRQLTVDRCRTSPTILNNILWNCVAESPEAFYVGLYSTRDSDPNLHVLNRLPKDDSLEHYLSQFHAYQTLQWFSDHYLFPTVTDTTVVLSDLRYGALSDSIRNDQDMVFRFITRPSHDHFEMDQRRPRPENFSKEFKAFITRILGY